MLWSGLPLLQTRIIMQDVSQYMVKIIKQQGRYVQNTLWSFSVHLHNTVNLTYKPEAGKKSDSAWNEKVKMVSLSSSLPWERNLKSTSQQDRI